MSGTFAPILVTGGAGFIGCNLAHRLCSQGRRVRVFDALSRPGVERNLEWLASAHGDLVEPVLGDVRDGNALAAATQGIAAAFHFAAQVAVTSSMTEPRADLETNILGTFNLLEAVRAQSCQIPVIFASTNKVYGDLATFRTVLTDSGYAPADAELAGHGVSEAMPLDFHTPYGCSKGAADQYVLDYARSYSMPTAVMRMSCIYGERQMGTEDQGWVAHFLIQALQDRPITIYGDGHQVRDILDVENAVDAYLALLGDIAHSAGRVFNLGGGPGNAVSLHTLLGYISALVGRTVEPVMADWRPGDQRWFVADTRRATAKLQLGAPLHWRNGVARLASWLAKQHGVPLARQSDQPLAAVS